MYGARFGTGREARTLTRASSIRFDGCAYFLLAQSQGAAQRHWLWQAQVSPQVQRASVAFAHPHAACAHPHWFCSC